MLSNAYFLAKFRFDTAEKEPAKNLQINFFKKFQIGLQNGVGRGPGPGGMEPGLKHSVHDFPPSRAKPNSKFVLHTTLSLFAC